MFKCINLFLAFFLSFNVYSNEELYHIGIYDIDDSQAEYSAIYGSDGRIYNVSKNNEKLLAKLKFAHANHLEVKLDFGRSKNLNVAIDSLEFETRPEIVDIELRSTELDSALLINKSFYKTPDSTTKEKFEIANLQNSYVTNFSSEEDLEAVFNSQRRSFRSRSQCYNRAHVWSWELNKMSYGGKKIQPGKMWIFYSKEYIRKYNFRWWFHVSPYVTVNNEIKIIDRTFLKTPTSEDQWVNSLSRVKISCSEVRNYSSYREESIPADCYFIKTSLFYWQPWQIKNAELENQERSGWNAYELKRAYRNGVGWFTDVP